MKEELKALGLSGSDLENVSGGIIVAEAGNQKYWLVRQNGIDQMSEQLKRAQQLIKLCKDKLTKTDEEIKKILAEQ